MSSTFPAEMPSPSPFMDALLANAIPSLDSRDNKMLTENGDLTFRSSGNALVDLFFELEDVISGTRLQTCLDNAWDENPDVTLRIIWNARSIHLGKSSRSTFYRALGWLSKKHPKTLLANLPWLVRPLIQKKGSKNNEHRKHAAETAKNNAAEDVKADAIMVDAPESESDFEFIDEKAEADDGALHATKAKLEEDSPLSEFDVKYGVAHGYWKDLLNILALAANDELKVDGDPRNVLNVDDRSSKKHLRDWAQGRKKDVVKERHQRVLEKLKEDEFYLSLHNTVARLFADQLKLDTARLKSSSKADKKRITLAAKWAPSAEGMHDNHTFIVGTIAELLHPLETLTIVDPPLDPGDRKRYLKHARIAYQSKTLSPLRKFLKVVERDITAEKFENIMYERVTSLAMQQYAPLFIRKDQERFEKYIDSVAGGSVRISGAVLLPSTLVAAVRKQRWSSYTGNTLVKKRIAEKEREMMLKTIGGQWNSLVQHLKDSGTLESSIAVCDVSGSMESPRFPDGTCPIDSSIGLSLLLAEIVKPPFGGAMITFSALPQIIHVGGAEDKRTFTEKLQHIENADAGFDTNFVAVFENLLLPLALEHKLKKEDMVKQVFVFSDMQFNEAEASHRGPLYAGGAMPASGYSRQDIVQSKGKWSTSYERIKAKFEEAGYDMPRLIFWNLAGGRRGYGSGGAGDDTAPKPVEAHEEGTALVSGYSQGQMKMFLDNGSFEDPDAENDVQEVEVEDGMVVLEKEKKDSLALVKKAIGHDAYRMLKVVD